MCFKGAWCCLCCKCRKRKSPIKHVQEGEVERRGLLNGQEAVEESVGSEQGNVTEAVSQAINEPQHTTVTNSLTDYVCQPDEGTDSFDGCTPDNIPKFNEILKGKIKEIVCAYIRSADLLHLFHKYNENVLTVRDIVKIKKEMKRNGHYEGADLLLERLVAYKGWFQCLIQVLKDPSTKLHHVAEKLQKIRDKLAIKYAEYITQPENESAGQSEASEVNIFNEIIAEVKQNYKTLLEEIKQLKTTNVDRDKLIKSLQKHLEQVNDINGQSASQLQVCHEEITQLKLEKECIEKENKNYQVVLALQLQACQEEIAQLNLEIDQSASQLQKCQEEIAQIKLEKECIEEEKKNYQDDLGKLNSHLQECQEEIAELKYEKERIEKENKNHQDDLELTCDKCKLKRKMKLNQRWISSLKERVRDRLSPECDEKLDSQPSDSLQ